MGGFGVRAADLPVRARVPGARGDDRGRRQPQPDSGGLRISVTFNPPVTGVSFGVKIILRELFVDTLLTVVLPTIITDITAEPFLSTKPFLTGFPGDHAVTPPELGARRSAGGDRRDPGTPTLGAPRQISHSDYCHAR